MMMGERDLEAELKEKDEIIMSLRLNEHLLKDKVEISRRNMSKQLERITALEKENTELKKQLEDCNQNRELRKVLKDNRSMAEVVERNKELEKENEKLQRRLSLYEMNEDEVDKYLRTHPMPTITNERTIIPLGIRHRCD